MHKIWYNDNIDNLTLNHTIKQGVNTMSIFDTIDEVKNELKSKNLLTDVEVIVHSIGGSRGYYEDEGEPQIHINKWTPLRVGEQSVRKLVRLTGNSMSAGVTTTQVLYHEFGHAYAEDKFNYGDQAFIREYISLFGSPYEEDESGEMEESEYDSDIHISEYAATSPDEDFAEIFMAYCLFGENWLWSGEEYLDGVQKKMDFVHRLSSRGDTYSPKGGKVRK